MTYFQSKFIENLRFWRKKRGFSQLKLSEMVNISPNYLNAVEKGKNFPSPEVIQNISNYLGILPFQLFIEHPANSVSAETAPLNSTVSELLIVKQRFIKDINELIQKYENTI